MDALQLHFSLFFARHNSCSFPTQNVAHGHALILTRAASEKQRISHVTTPVSGANTQLVHTPCMQAQVLIEKRLWKTLHYCGKLTQGTHYMGS